MPGTAGPNLGLTYGWVAAETGWGTPYNADLRKLNHLVMGSVISAAIATPPGSPAFGDRYVVAASPTGAWVGHQNHVAVWDAGAWVFYTPVVGWALHNVATDRMIRWDGTTWGPWKSRSHPGIVTGFTSYLFTPGAVLSVTAAAVNANRIYYQPFPLDGTIDRIAIEVTTGAAGLARLGIYANANGAPGALLVDAGTVDTTAAAIVAASFTALTVHDQWVWLAATFNATPQVRNGGLGAAWLIGSASFSVANRAYYTDVAFGALPGTAPALTGVSGTAPLVGVRKS